jgi:uncharacterized protein (DUF2141 family)
MVVFLTCLLVLPIATAADQNRAQARIRVRIVGLHNNTGVVRCALYSSADGFPTQP